MCCCIGVDLSLIIFGSFETYKCAFLFQKVSKSEDVNTHPYLLVGLVTAFLICASCCIKVCYVHNVFEKSWGAEGKVAMETKSEEEQKWKENCLSVSIALLSHNCVCWGLFAPGWPFHSNVRASFSGLGLLLKVTRPNLRLTIVSQSCIRALCSWCFHGSDKVVLSPGSLLKNGGKKEPGNIRGKICRLPVCHHSMWSS